MPTYTKVTRMVWTPVESMYLESVQNARAPYIADEVAAGRTDGIPTYDVGGAVTRLWIDQASAQAWKDFITEIASACGATCTVQIDDYPPAPPAP